ncbi:hypothetical protein B0E52_13055 [Rhodanobacter sp. C06]|uniref:restriction endonuclease subunit S n=1 Tax=Rhodanobacter sp. C06 TaxID=1945854 RepID=UPI000984F9DC|nr:restriction endonuclease subunit S [Rhodanobacter sp. C06]OOG39610.1 hypothetical protein B0E52_13055 [Rhodanobacter sp. C06]
MAKEDKATATLAPKLRFPAFRTTPGWCVKRMDRLYAFMRNNILSRDKLNYDAGHAKNIHYGDIHTKFPALFDVTKERTPFVNDTEEVPAAGSEDYCIEGDIIFADASEDTNDVGKSMEIVRLNGEPVLSGQHTILARRKDESLIVGFGGYLFRSGWIRSRIKKEAQGTKVYQISASRLGGIDITYPSEAAEQQKIADCLTSLDEVIAAQGRKVEALKAHKRGLMQQLFPRIGETSPRLRFPEFRNAPEWKKVPLGKVAEIKLGKMLDADKQKSGRLLPYVNNISLRWNEVDTSNLPRMYFKESELERYSLQKGDVLVCEGGVPGRSAVWDGRLPDLKFQKAIHRVRFHVPFVPKVLVLYLEAIAGTNAFESLFTGGGIKHLTGETFAKLAIPVMPLPEQQRIADCLSSLDTQITAESNQLAALKTHKQGLMQQLFPNTNEK